MYVNRILNIILSCLLIWYLVLSYLIFFYVILSCLLVCSVVFLLCSVRDNVQGKNWRNLNNVCIVYQILTDFPGELPSESSCRNMEAFPTCASWYPGGGPYEKIPHIFVPTSDLCDLRILSGLLTFFQHQNPWGLWKKWSELLILANLRDSNLCRWQKVSEKKWLLVRFPSTEHTGWCIDGYTKHRTPPPSPKQGDHLNGSSWVWLKCSYFTKIWDFSQKNFEIFFSKMWLNQPVLKICSSNWIISAGTGC